MPKVAVNTQSEVKTQHPLDITLRIASAMDRINHRNHPYDKAAYDKIEAVIHVLQRRNLHFTPEIIEALAEGNPKNPVLVYLRNNHPQPYRLLTDLLDELYTVNEPKE